MNYVQSREPERSGRFANWLLGAYRLCSLEIITVQGPKSQENQLMYCGG